MNRRPTASETLADGQPPDTNVTPGALDRATATPTASAAPDFGDAHESQGGAPEGDLLDVDPAKMEAGGRPTVSTANPYDPAFLALSQDFVGEAHVKKQWDVIRVEKPSKARVFRVHPDPRFRLKTVLLTLKEDNEVFLVLPQLRQNLANEGTCGVFMLLACVTKQGTPFLWPIRMADPDGKWNVWHQSAWQIAEKAMTRWTRMQANRDAGHYVAEYDQRPIDQQHEPTWPDLTFGEWLRLGFQGSTIDSMEHPVMKRLHLED
jgi:hypothetical protein